MITIIAAVADNGVIGHQGDLPWRLPEDLRRFRDATMGKACIMGRKTWESLPESKLPGRLCVVLSREPYVTGDTGAEWAADAAPVLVDSAQRDPEIMVIGGAEIYAMALPHAERMLLTRVHQSPEGDAFFPAFDASWQLVASEPGEGCTFETWERAA